MRAITFSKPGGREVLTWSEVPDPKPESGEVVIDVAASAVNRADLMQRQGKYPPPPGASPYLGLEASGTIVEVGRGVTDWSVGDEVTALLAGGGYAERVAVPAAQLLPVPRGVTLVEAAALPEVAATVWSNVFSTARFQPGEVLLVHGGAGGIGTFALQLGSAYGARVFCTASGPKLEKCLTYGAERAIDYRSEDFVKIVKAETGDHGADIVLDIMGAKYLARNVDVLAPGGRLVVIGLRSRPVVEKAKIIAEVRDHVWPLIEAGRVQPVIDRVLAMQDAGEAHRVVAVGEHVGKVLLVR